MGEEEGMGGETTQQKGDKTREQIDARQVSFRTGMLPNANANAIRAHRLATRHSRSAAAWALSKAGCAAIRCGRHPRPNF